MKMMLILLLLNSFQSISQVVNPPTVQLPNDITQPRFNDSVILFIHYVEAQFPGGNAEMKRYFQNYRHESDWSDSLDSKRGYVSFVVEADGTLTDIKIVRGINPELDDIMLRMIEESPNWIPMSDEYGPVRSRVRLPISFIRPN